MDYEGPSSEDIARFSDETGHCPSCGEEIWDQAPRCAECGAYIDGTSSRSPMQAWFRHRTMVIVVLAVLAAFILLYVVRIF